MMNEIKQRKIVQHVIIEVKKYVCYCGIRGLDFSKIHFDGEISTQVDLKCTDKRCEHTRKVEIYYPDSIYN